MKIPRFNWQECWSFLSDKIRQNRQDILIVLILAVAAGFASYSLAQLISPDSLKRGGTIWFEADIPRVFSNMTDRFSNHYRVKVHPLFSLIGYFPVYLLRKFFDFELIVAVKTVIAIVASLWLGTLFIVLRLIGCCRWDAMLFSLLGAISAASVFWFTVPETYPFGSLSILLALGFAMLTEYYQISSLWYILVSTLTLSFTTTNWMVGILATAVNHRPKQSLQITVNAFALVTVLWGVQKYLFPSAVFFLGDKEEKKYLYVFKSASDYSRVIQSFFSHTLVMPEIGLQELSKGLYYQSMLTQASSPGSGSFWGACAVGLWIALLGLGLWGFFSSKKHTKFRIVLGFSLLGQLALHLVYGNETFLYSLHFLPLLIILAAFSVLTSTRLIALILAGILVICTGINNGLLFHQILQYFSH